MSQSAEMATPVTSRFCENLPGRPRRIGFQQIKALQPFDTPPTTPAKSLIEQSSEIRTDSSREEKERQRVSGESSSSQLTPKSTPKESTRELMFLTNNLEKRECIGKREERKIGWMRKDWMSRDDVLRGERELKQAIIQNNEVEVPAKIPEREMTKEEEYQLETEEDAWEVVDKLGSEDDRYEASELIEYLNHEWCVSLRICREQTTDKRIHLLLIYSHQRGIQRLPMTNEQVQALGNTLLLKYRINKDRQVEVLPIYSALPSTGLLSLKYRNNKGIELRVYGIVNFVDLEREENSQSRTMVWTDALGPIYLTAGDRSNIRRKLVMAETKIFAPLRLCQMTVKGDFNSNIPNGSFVRWTVTSFTPLIEEGPKDPNIGRNFWPARIIRLDDLVWDKKKNNSKRRNGTWLRSYSEKSVEVYAGNHLTSILSSAGPVYLEKGAMLGYVVPCFHQNKFVYFEALIVGPARVVMLITEGRYLNYHSKTWTPQVIRNAPATKWYLKPLAKPSRPDPDAHKPRRRCNSESGIDKLEKDIHNIL